MEITGEIHDRHHATDGAQRILVAVHGREPEGWHLDVARALKVSPRATVRVLAITDAPWPPSAGLLPAVRRAQARAHAEWRRLEETRTAQRIEALLAWLPAVAEVVWAHVSDADAARAIVARASAWGVDLIVVGVAQTGWPERRLLGAIHERVVARASSAVLVVPPRSRAATRARRGAQAWPGAGRRAAAAKGGA